MSSRCTGLKARLQALASTVLAIASVMQSGAHGQSAPASLDEAGHISVDGREAGYRIRNLPVSSFPELPGEVASALNSRGCVIPQTYEAKRPENVIHGSLERRGSSDWAVLCSVRGQVLLLVFFASGSVDAPITLATASKSDRLQPHDSSGELGFNWGIDPASPGRIHDAQAAMPHRPPAPDHDSIADTTIDHGTVYHLYRNGAWETVNID